MPKFTNVPNLVNKVEKYNITKYNFGPTTIVPKVVV